MPGSMRQSRGLQKLDGHCSSANYVLRWHHSFSGVAYMKRTQTRMRAAKHWLCSLAHCFALCALCPPCLTSPVISKSFPCVRLTLWCTLAAIVVLCLASYLLWYVRRKLGSKGGVAGEADGARYLAKHYGTSRNEVVSTSQMGPTSGSIDGRRYVPPNQ